MQKESISIANLENDGSEPKDGGHTASFEHDAEPKDGGPTVSSEHDAEPELIDETSVMQVELATSTGDVCPAEEHGGVSCETVMEEPIQELVVPMQEDDAEANDTAAREICKDPEGHASGSLSIPVESDILPTQEDGAEATADDLPIVVEAEVLNTEPAPAGESAKHGEADTEQQLPPSSGEAMVDVSSVLANQEGKEAPSTDLSANPENVEMEKAAVPQGLLNTEAATGLQEGMGLADPKMHRNVSMPSTAQPDATADDVSIVVGAKVLNTEPAPSGENAEVGEGDTEQQLPPSSSMVNISCEAPSQERKEAPSTDPSGNDENAKTENTSAAQVLQNIEPARGGEKAKHGESDTEQQLIPLSSEVVIDTSSELHNQEGKEAPSTDPSGSDENAKTGKAAAVAQELQNTESSPDGESTKLAEADTERQLIPLSSDVMIDTSSELPNQGGKEAPSTDPLGDDENAKLETAAAVLELSLPSGGSDTQLDGSTTARTEGGSDQPLPAPRGQDEDAEADGSVK
uniref:Uncharacterized protein n=1 Tax=Arundo donax TaxID=35708 RepID=A0A0A9EUJ5_ARUDO